MVFLTASKCQILNLFRYTVEVIAKLTKQQHVMFSSTRSTIERMERYNDRKIFAAERQRGLGRAISLSLYRSILSIVDLALGNQSVSLVLQLPQLIGFFKSDSRNGEIRISLEWPEDIHP